MVQFYFHRDRSFAIRIEDSVSYEATDLLIELGLGFRQKGIVDAWQRDTRDVQRLQSEFIDAERRTTRAALKADFPRFKILVKNQMLARVVSLYP